MVHAKQGDLGSVVLKPRPSGTVWKRGSVVQARWQMTARHGGGYMFRLCPASAPLTEACFQKTPLPFANTTHRAPAFRLCVRSLLSVGIKNAAVFPRPVLAMATTSRPSSAGGIDFR